MDLTGANIVALVLGIIAAAVAFITIIFALADGDGEIGFWGGIAALVAFVFLTPTCFIASHHAANHQASRDLKRQHFRYIDNIATDFNEVTFKRNGCTVKVGLYSIVGTYQVYAKPSGATPHRVLPETIDKMLTICSQA